MKVLYRIALLGVLLLTACSTPDTPQTAASPAARTTDAVPDTPEAEDLITVLFFGDSITAGFGLDPEDAFPALLQQRVDSLGWPVRMINGGNSGETSTGGLARIGWVLERPVDVFVLELGGNDGLRGTNLAVTKQNLQAIIDTVRSRGPATEIIIAGMEIPPNLGQERTAQFRAIFPDLARTNDTALIPFLLDGVGGIPELNLPDGIHPTAEGHAIVAETMWQSLRPILERRMAE